jgi:integrase
MGRKSTGTAWRQKSGAWRVQLTLHKPGDAKARRWSTTIPARKDQRPITQSYADDLKERLLERWAGGGWDPWATVDDKPAAALTVGEYLTTWISKQTHETRGDDANRVRRYIVPSVFGRSLLAEIRPKHVVAFLEHLGTLGSRHGGKLAPRSVRNIYSVIHRAFARACIDEVWDVSPCEAVAKAGVLPPVVDKDPTARRTWRYTRTEVVALTSDPRIPPDRHVLYAIWFLTGCRIGEAAALRVADYEPDVLPLGRITFARSWQTKTRRMKSTKTAAIKEAPVHPYLATLLRAWLAVGRTKLLAKVKQATDLLVPTKNGTPRLGYASHEALTKDLARLGFPPRGMQQHAARHTFISLARSDGARRDILRWVTHAPPRSGDFDGYTSPEWEALCIEVAKLRIARDSARTDG